MAKFSNLINGITGLINEMYKETEISKGFEEPGGIDGMMIYARGGNASDVKAYKSAKERYDALQAMQYVDEKGEIITDLNGNPVPARNPDGSIKRDLSGNIVFMRHPRKPSPYDFPIK